MASADENRIKPVPVILACATMPQLWPLSSAQEPFVFRSDASGSSPVRRILAELSTRSDMARPLLFVSDTAIEAARDQLAGLGADVCVVVVPAGESRAYLAILAALLSEAKTRETPLVFIPASFRCPDLRSFLDAIAGAIPKSAASLTPLACIRPVRHEAELSPLDLALEISGRDMTSGLPYAHLLDANAGEDINSALIEMSALVKSVGVFVTSADFVLSVAARVHPAMIDACKEALRGAECHGNWIRAQQAHLALVSGMSLTGLWTASQSKLLAFQLAEGCHLVRSLSDLPGGAESLLITPDHVGVPLVIEGYDDCRLYSSGDGILIIKRNQERAAKHHAERPRERSPAAYVT